MNAHIKMLLIVSIWDILPGKPRGARPHPAGLHGVYNMEAFIEQNRQILADLCRKYHVSRLDVFGSVAVGDFDESSSDIDFLVEFNQTVNDRRFDNYFELLRELERLFGRNIDLVEQGGLRNPYFIRRVNETRRQVYAAT